MLIEAGCRPTPAPAELEASDDGKSVPLRLAASRLEPDPMVAFGGQGAENVRKVQDEVTHRLQKLDDSFKGLLQKWRFHDEPSEKERANHASAVLKFWNGDGKSNKALAREFYPWVISADLPRPALRLVEVAVFRPTLTPRHGLAPSQVPSSAVYQIAG